MNAIGDDGGVALGKALQLQASLSTVSATGKATLVDLDVSKNQLDAAACSALLMPATELCRSTGTVVEARNGLRRLNLFGNRVGDEVIAVPMISFSLPMCNHCLSLRREWCFD